MGFGTCGDRFGDNETDVPPPGAYELDSEVIKGGRKGKSWGDSVDSFGIFEGGN